MSDLTTHYWGLGGLSHCGRDVGMQNGHAYTNNWDNIDCLECLVYKPHARKEEEPVLHNYYVTFGVMYAHETHPYWAGARPDGWLEVIAEDYEAAAALVRSYIGCAFAFMYEADRFDRSWHPAGRLATISQDGVLFPVEGVGAPTPRFSKQDPEWWGRASDEAMCARIEGTLAENSDPDCIANLGYEAEHVHFHCFQEGVAMFREVTDVDYRVLAGELDWSDQDQYVCAVCKEGIL